MKKILYMSGAVKNSGDFLIEKRTMELFERFMSGVEVTREVRVGTNWTDRIDYLNSFNAIVYSGGPIYQRNIYPTAIPFVNKGKWGG